MGSIEAGAGLYDDEAGSALLLLQPWLANQCSDAGTPPKTLASGRHRRSGILAGSHFEVYGKQLNKHDTDRDNPAGPWHSSAGLWWRRSGMNGLADFFPG